MPERQPSQPAGTHVMDHPPVEAVRKNIRVRADIARACRVFTEEMDSW